MHAIWTIAKRELASFFDSLIAYIMLVLFLGFSGFFTWLFGSNIFFTGQASLGTFFSVAYWTLFFFIPALTMRLLAEENKTGTIELLLTKAVTDRQVVIGKFLSTLMLIAIALLFTLPYVITVANLGNLDIGRVICGYFGLLLMSAAYIAIGLYASSITSNQIVAFLTALFIGLFFHLIFGVLSNNFTSWMGHVFETLSLSDHFQSISRGVLDSRDVIYFLSIVFLGLFLAEYSLSRRNIEPPSRHGDGLMRSKLYVSIALIVGIVIAVNLLSDEYHLRLDLTENHAYTLSHATKDILKHLDEPVTVTAYFSKDLPPRVLKARRDFQDLLIEYANRSRGMLMYKFIDPNGKESDEQAATKSGIRPVVINVREKDQMKQQKAFMGAIVSLGKNKQVIPFLGPGSSMEYALSSAIKKLSVTHKPVIGFLQGNGEPSLREMPQATKQLQVLYQTQPVTLTDSTFIPSDIKTMAVIAPADSFSTTNLHQLDTFLARGGRLLLAVNRVNGNMRMGRGTAVHTGLGGWLRDKGIVVGKNFVVDAQCASIQMQQQQQSFFNFQTSIPFPYFPVISQFAKHPVTSGLESVIMRFASTIRYTGDSSVKFTPLAFTSALSDSLEAPQFFSLQKQWTQNDFTQKKLVVAAALQGHLSGNREDPPSKMVVIGDGDFAVNGPPRQAQQLQPDNVSLLSNAIDWLSDDTGLIALRTKGITSRPIREISDASKTILKYLNFLLPILLAIGYGLIRARKTRRTRLQRMHEDYAALP
jgi:gliding-associated putative ABC transporter substrate-binding component GldG